MRFIVRSLKVGILSAAVAATGCHNLPWQSKKEPEQQQSLSIMNKGAPLIGPDSRGETSNAPSELDPKRASQACLTAAGEMEKAGQTEEAIRLYEIARKDYPNLATAISRRLGILYDKAGDFPKATAEYEIALKATPNDSELLSDMGYSYYCRGQANWATAEKYLREAVKVQSSNKRAWLNLGMTLAGMGRWQESYDSFVMAVSPGEAHCNVAFCMASQAMTDEQKRGLVDDAKDQYRKALDIDPALQIARVGLTKLENLPPPGTIQQTAAKGHGDPNKISTIQELMEREKAKETAPKPKAKSEYEAPITLELP